MQKAKTLNDKWIEIFKAGKWTDSAGRVSEWSSGDLVEIVKSYDPKTLEAPVVLGHPNDDGAQAYGWVKNLRVTGDILEAQLSDVVPELDKWVAEGSYKKRSISLSGHQLRHVGFLGAANPAVQGLKDINFSQQDDDNLKFFEFTDDETKDTTDFSENIMNDKKQVVKVPVTFSDSEKGTKKQESATATHNMTQAVQNSVDSKNDDSRYAALEAQNTRLAKQLAALNKQIRNKEITETVDNFIKDGYLTPAQKNIAVALMSALDTVKGNVQFSDGTSISALNLFSKFLGSLPKQIDFTRVATAEKAIQTADSYSEDVDKKIDKLLAKRKEMSYVEALKEVVNG